MVVEYDEFFLLPSLMGTNKLILGNFEKVENLESQINFENMFQITMTSARIYRDLMSRKPIGFH